MLVAEASHRQATFDRIGTPDVAPQEQGLEGLNQRKLWSGLCWLVCLLYAGPAAAQVFQPFAQRYSTVANGDLVMLSNTSQTCQSPVGGSCVSGSGAKNDALVMVNTKLPADVADPTIFNSSSSDLTTAQLPSGAQVVKAQLYWGGLVGGSGGAPAPNPASTSVRLGRPGAAYQAVTPQNCVVSPTSAIWGGPAHHLYQCAADVTAAVQSGGIGTYRVANVPLQQGSVNRFGGWTLVLVIRNPAKPLRNFTINDGLAAIATTGTNPVREVSLTVSGFRTPLAGAVTAQVGWMAFDGDVAAIDGFTFQGQGSSTISLSDACNPQRDVFNSTTCVLGAPVTTRSVANGNGTNTLGFDTDVVQLPNAGNVNLRNGATSAVLTARTDSEGYGIAVLTTAIDVYRPSIDGSTAKSQANLTNPGLPAGQALPGDQIRYTIALNNIGQDNAAGVTITDAIPAGTEFVPGSLQVTAGADVGPRTDAAGDDQAELSAGNAVFRVGTGATALQGGLLRCTACSGTGPTNATVSFVVKVRDDAAPGSTITNAARVQFQGVSSGEEFDENTNQVQLRIAAPPRLTLAKVIAGRAVATDQFTLSISNGGPSVTSAGTATSVTTPAYVATAGTTYTLSETGAGTPAANLGHYNIAYSCVNVEGGTTEVPSGTASSFQVAPVVGDDITCTFANTPRRANLSVTKDNGANSLVSGAQTTYQIVVANAGPDAADGAVVKDPAGTGLTSCVLATPACTAAGGATCPVQGSAAGQLSIANLQGAGVAIPALPNGGSATFRVTCTVQ